MIFACPLMAEWRKERFHIRFGTLEKGKKKDTNSGIKIKAHPFVEAEDECCLCTGAWL